MSELNSMVPALNIAVLSILISFLVYRYIIKSFNYWKEQGIPYVPRLQNFLEFLNVATFQLSIGHFLCNYYHQMKVPYFGIWVYGTPHFIVKDPELIKNVLQKDFEYFTDKTTFNDKSIDPIGCRFLFLEKMPEWLIARKTLAPAFTTTKLKAAIPLIIDCAKQMTRYISRETDNGNSNICKPKSLAMKYSVAVISSCAFGIESNTFDDEHSKFLECGREMFGADLDNGIRSLAYFFMPSIAATFKLTFGKPKIYKFLNEAFAETFKMREKSGETRGDLIDYLLQMKKTDELNGVPEDPYKKIAYAVQFFVAAAETTGSVVSFMLYEIALNQQIQSRLREEIQSNLGEDGIPTYDALNNMKYLTMCIQESLRKYPVLPFLDRRCMRDYAIPDGSGHVIKRGTPVYIPLLGLHQDPQYFPDPERFDPDRFNFDNVQNQQRHPFSYLPFGHGPHICIGQRFGLISTKMALIHILSNFKVDRCEKTPVPIVYDAKSFLLHSVDELYITLSTLK